MRKCFSLVAALTAFLTFGSGAAFAAAFTLTATGMADNGMLPPAGGFDKTSSDGRVCGGENRAPGFTWTNAPAKAQSFAILELDPDGGAGRGVSHWVIYNIPKTVTAISAAEIAANPYTTGRGTGDLVGYRGPCPPPGDAPHHYVVTIYALDVPPTLAPSLDRTGVLAAIAGHVVGATTTVMRFQTPAK